ncbi:MAG: type III-A CRISPR-associated RAMP protein Csm4 [Candidatus Woesearchaeota archaeon]
MEKVLKFYLDNKSKFHIGDNKDGLKEIFSSDQLYSALINKLAILYPERLVELIEKFNQNNRLSSMFYGLRFEKEGNEDAEEIFFLSKPYAPLITKTEDIQTRKLLKKVKYISTAAITEILLSWDKESKYFNVRDLEFETISNKFLLLKKELTNKNIKSTKLQELKFIKHNDRPRISIDRYTNKSEQFFYQKNIEFQYQKTGEFIIKPFIYSIISGSLDDEFIAAIRLLADEGIGGKRSSGLGIFKHFEIDNTDLLNLKLNQTGDYYLSLATLFPDEKETKSILNYDLEKRSGYIYSKGGVAMRKKSVRVIREGAIFEDKINGQVFNLAPEAYNEHPVYLFGKALSISFGGDN